MDDAGSLDAAEQSVATHLDSYPEDSVYSVCHNVCLHARIRISIRSQEAVGLTESPRVEQL